MTTTIHVALRTVTTEGVPVTDRPTAERVIAVCADYLTILRICRLHRTDTYRHRKTGVVRVISEQQAVGCGYTDVPLFDWLGGADLVSVGGYAIPVDVADLAHYEPKPTPDKTPA